MVSLGALLNRTEFGLELLVDPGGARNLAVRRVFTTDQPRPARFLSGGELVLTGLIFMSEVGAEDALGFVESAKAGGAIAIGVGLDWFGIVPDSFIAACHRLAVPLFSVPPDVSFADINQVFILSGEARAHRLLASLERSRSLLAALAQGRALDDLAAAVMVGTGIGCTIMSAAGKRVATVGTAYDEDAIDRFTDAVLTAAAFPLTVGEAVILPIGTRRDLTAAWYLVLDRAIGDLGHEEMAAMGEFASVAALVRARDSEVRRLRNEKADAAIADLIDGSAALGDGAVLLANGVDPRRLRPLVSDALVAIANVSVGVRGEDVIAHLPADPVAVDAAAEQLVRNLNRVAPTFGAQIKIGLSPVTSADGLGGAYRGTHHAARLAVPDTSVSLTSTRVLGSAPALYSHLPNDVRTEFTHRVLGPLEEHDSRTEEGGLVETLRTFLACDCSWVRTAAALHVHQNTVRYRVNKAQELTGRDLTSTADRLDLHLALSLR